MKKLFFLSFICALLITASPLRADRLSESMIKLDRQKTNTATTGMICAQPTAGGSENDVQVTFPSNFTVSSNLSNWSVTTADILTTSSPWPGIAQATSVAGKIVTFPSGDLSLGTTYCFRWTNANAITTGAVGNQVAQLRTRNAGAATIDTSGEGIGIYVSANDQVSVNGVVPASPNDLLLTFSSDPESSTIIDQGDEVTFTLAFESLVSGTEDITLEAYWEDGTIEGSSASIEAFEYVIGSATSAGYGDTPIVDLVNQRITWDLQNVPGGDSGFVTFKLRSKASYGTNSEITVPVKAMGTIITTDTPEETLTFTLQTFIQPTSIPGPTSTPTPGAPPSISVTPTPVSEPFIIESVSIEEITDSSTTLEFVTNEPSTFELDYGLTPSDLSTTINGLQYSETHTVDITGLAPGIRYYFQIKVRNRAGQQIGSDVYTFTTADNSYEFSLGKEIITLTANRLLLSSAQVEYVVLPKNTSFSLNAHLDQGDYIETITVELVNKEVLGLTTFAAEPKLTRTQLVEILPGVFSGELTTPNVLGKYDLIFSISDVSGGMYRKKAPYTIVISDPVRVYDKETNKPIEDAFVDILRYEENRKRFAPISDGFDLNQYTDTAGELPVALPEGRYIFEVSAIGYRSQKLEMNLGTDTLEYPRVELTPGFSLFDTIRYYSNSLSRTFSYIAVNGDTLFGSQLARDSFILLSQILLIFLALNTLALRMHSSVRGVISLGFQSIKHLVQHNGNDYHKLTVRNEHNEIVAGVLCIIKDSHKKLIEKAHSSVLGEIRLSSSQMKNVSFPIQVMLSHPHYRLLTQTISERALKADVNLEIFPDHESLTSFVRWLKSYHMLMLYDIALISIVFGTIIFTYYHGVIKMLPMLISIPIIVGLWIMYLKQLWQTEKSRSF